MITASLIAAKYVHGLHDALTDSQEKKEMERDIKMYAKIIAVQVMEECARKAEIEDDDETFSRIGDRVYVKVDKESILNVDIEQFLK